MRSFAVAVVFTLSPNLLADDRNLPVITPADVGKHVKQKCIVEMQIKNVGKSSDGKMIFLNSEENFRDNANFGVVLDLGIVEKFKEAKITDVRAHFLNKKVRVTGTITTYKDRPQIRLDEINQIQIVDKK